MARAMVDVHVLMDPARAKWHRQCLGSLDGQPVVVHQLPAAATVAEGRLAGLALGKLPYVSWVDDDDYVAADFYASAVELLRRNPKACGVYASEASLVNGYVARIHPPVDEPWSLERMADYPYVHNGLVIRRAAVEPCLADLAGLELPDAALRLAVTHYGPWIHLRKVGYYWRRHAGGASRRIDRREAVAAAMAVGLRLASEGPTIRPDVPAAVTPASVE